MANKAGLIVLTHVMLSEQMDKFDRDTLQEFQDTVSTAFDDETATNITNGICLIVTGLNKANDSEVQLQT